MGRYVDLQLLLRELEKRRKMISDYPYSISVLDGIVEMIKALPTVELA